MPDTAIGVEGRTVRCAKCKHSWFQEPQPLDLTEAESADDAPAPAAQPDREPAAQPAPPEPSPAPSSDPVGRNEPAAPSISRWHSTDRPDAVPTPAPRPEPEPPAPFSAAPRDPLGHADDDEGAEGADFAFGEDEYGSDDENADEFRDEQSRFDYSPPFTRRRNSLKMWTIAAAVFAVLASGTVVAVNYYGLPDWLPIQRPTFGVGKTNLELDFPAAEQRKETLDTGEEIFRVRGSINNTGTESVTVPRLLIVFRDEREKNVYSWLVEPSKRELAPGESLNVTEAVTDIPPAARAAEIGWSPN